MSNQRYKHRTLTPNKKLVRTLLRPAPANCHKGTFGHVGVLCGEHSMQGAAVLCGYAALRAGAGKVSLFGEPFISGFPELVCHTYHDGVKHIPRLCALVIGPGLGNDLARRDVAVSYLTEASKKNIPVVVDADALSLLKENIHLFGATLIATPHPKEAAQLLDIPTEEIQNNRPSACDALASLPINRNNRVIWILKGANSIVFESHRSLTTFKSDIATLSVAGSGDVLSGIIAALLIQTSDPFDAAMLGVNTHLLAGKYLSKKALRGHLAREIADATVSILFK